MKLTIRSHIISPSFSANSTKLRSFSDPLKGIWNPQRPPRQCLTVRCISRRSSEQELGSVSNPTPELLRPPGSNPLHPVDQSVNTESQAMTSAFTPATEKRNSFFGVHISADIMAISSVYFVQGVLGISRLAVAFMLKDEFHLDPAERAVFSGVAAFPWLIKPLYGFISDGLPLFGYRRRSYLILCGLLGTTAWLSLSSIVSDKYFALAMITLSSLSVAVADVVVDSMVVERARHESQSTSGSLQSLCWGSSSFGAVVSAYFSGSLVESYGPRFVFGLTAVLPLITSVVGCLVEEAPVNLSLAKAHGAIAAPNQIDSEGGTYTQIEDNSKEIANLGDRIKSQLAFLYSTMKQPAIFLPTVFIVVWQATPVSDSAMFYFTTNKLGFGPEFLGRVQLVTAVASLLGVGVFNFLLKDVPLRKIFFWTTLLGSGLGLTQLLLVTGLNQKLGISDQFFTVGDSLVLTVLGQVSFMPVLVLAAKLCPSGVEATVFATLMSIFNGAGVMSDFLSASLTKALGVTSTEFDNLALLIVLCNVSSLLPIPFLGLLLPIDVEEDNENKAIVAPIDIEKNE